ncbi:MAG: cellulase family glycosylhydrolase [Clostridium sp.]|nr:cellulase family glycosylhydrolase [Bacteroides sp.]MCM1197777.1 cellulase family glycosylhydrolase [Clostridium sp.]
MKVINNIFKALMPLACLLSCTPDGGEKNEYVPLAVDVSSLEFTADGGEQTFGVTASEKVFVVPGADWIKVSAGVADENMKWTVSVVADANSSREERATRISVVAGDEKKYVDVRQDAVEPAPGPQPQDNAAWQVLARLGIGWNLGNHMDSHVNGTASETAWGNPKATQETFIRLKAAGYSTVRIPVTWLGKFGLAPDYRIDEAWLERVAEIVGYAENAGLNAIVNMHHDGGDSQYWLDIKSAAADASVHAEIIAQIKAMWTQIATRFKDSGDFLVFESFNEIHDGGWGWGANLTDGGKQYRCLNEWNQAFVDAVRATGGNNTSRYLAVPGYCTNPDLTIANFVMPEDSAKDRIIVAVHYYDPSEYTLTAKYSEWGNTASASKKAPGSGEDQVTGTFSRLYAKFISEGIPVYIGEMGCVNRATEREQKFQQYWFEYVVKAAKTYGMAPFVWDNGAAGTGEERHAFINHGTGEYCSAGAKAAVEVMTRAMNNDDASYTLESVYENAPR